MRKYSNKYVRFLLKKSRNSSVKKRKRKFKQHKKIISNNYVNDRYTTPAFAKVVAPNNFTLKYEDSVEMINFINKLKICGNKRENVEIIMDAVSDIGEGAICMLLSVIHELNDLDLYVRGTKPDNKAVNSILERSGFFSYLNAYVSKENISTKNKILKTGSEKTKYTLFAKEVNSAMDTIWGVRARCPELYGGLMEMNRNACDHAFSIKQKITWHCGFSHFENEKKVKFVFVDNGKGIIDSFTSTSFMKSVLKVFKDNTDLLITAFNDGIESRTGLSWRGKGLPTIYEMYRENVIKKLVVITNNVYIDFDRQIHITLPVSYRGTYYYWEIDNNCKPSYFI